MPAAQVCQAVRGTVARITGTVDPAGVDGTVRERRRGSAGGFPSRQGPYCGQDGEHPLPSAVWASLQLIPSRVRNQAIRSPLMPQEKHL
jgi:hypothetical protein